MRRSVLLTATLFALGCLAAPASAEPSGAPYAVEVWADASYDAQGRATEVSFPQKDAYPAAFLENLRQRLLAEPIQARQSEGQPARFETGVRIAMTITPATGSVAVDRIERLPRVVRMTDVRLPDALYVTEGWNGTVQIRCVVTRKGRCTAPAVASPDGAVPPEAARLAQAAMGGWRFMPQKLDGKAIESEAIVPFTFNTEGVVPPTLKGRSY